MTDLPNPPPALLPPGPPTTAELLRRGLLHMGDLRALSVQELRKLADQLGMAVPSGTKKSDLVLEILREHLGGQGIMFGDGVLEVLPDGFGFLRSPDYSYLPSREDIYLSSQIVAKHGMKTGLQVGGQVRPPRDNERYFTLTRVEQVSDASPLALPALTDFDDLTPLHPNRQLVLETGADDLAMRTLDLLAPVGFGQRGLIVAPPRAGKTVLLQQVANAITTNYPDAILLVLLIDERPEEVTDMERSIDGEVVASTFDEPPARHIQVAEMVLEKAKRLVEFGHDVVILLDSITRLGRAYNAQMPTSGKVLTGGVDAGALQKPKRFFGSARNVEEGGSLTVLATALIETGSRMDEVIFEEFKGTGNLEWVLDRRLAERRLYPALDPQRSGTRMEDRILDADQLRLSWILRKLLGEMNPAEGLELLLDKVRSTASNRELLEATLRG